MARVIAPSQLGAALASELSLYAQEVIDDVNAAGEQAIKKLVKITKGTAPSQSGRFAKSLTYVDVTKPTGDKEFIWGAKAPLHRITHLVVKGHATVNGGRAAGNPFLENAMETVLPEYERAVEEAIRR